MENKERNPDQCIERRDSDYVRYFTVSEYDADVRRGRRFRYGNAMAFWGLIWTEGAPNVEHLSTEWTEARHGSLRICDWDTYDEQMRELLGISALSGA